jgi:hypothetical protein
MRRVAFIGTMAVMLVLAAVAYAASVTCDGGRCEGTDENDQITGSLQVDAIYAKAGEDEVRARTGHDLVRAGGGGDFIEGAVGADTLRGGPGGDFLDGGQGDDHIYGQDGGVIVAGVSFTEVLFDFEPNDADAVYGGPGYEAVNVEDGDGDDYVDCGADRGRVLGSDEGDVIEHCNTGDS